MKYRLEFTIIKTGKTYHGPWLDSKVVVDAWVEHLNEKHKDEISHRTGQKIT